jgi:CheY-like chemotaxis protein/tRNA A-37 threonylcarbamoyl transferase component Bud32
MNIESYILLANREEKFLNTVCQSLLDAGYPVLTATTMSAALNLISKHTVVLIFSDTQLEDFSGHDFLKFLKNSRLLSKIPFVFFESLPSDEIADKAVEADSMVEDEVSKVLEAFEMGAADFIAYDPEEELSKVLMERIGKMLPSMVGNERISESVKEADTKASAQSPAAIAPAPQDRRDTDRDFTQPIENVELSRDGLLWLPGKIINVSAQGLLIQTSLLGRLDMLLYVRVSLPAGKRIINSVIKHISIGKNQLSAEIGVQVETSKEWIETYNYMTSMTDTGIKATALDETPVIGKKIDVKMIMQADNNKTQRVDVEPLLDNSNDSGREKALEVKFYRSLIGKQLGNYRAVSFIGAGAMGGVFQGWDVVLERHVALKVISYNLSTVESYRNMFFQEARLVSRLSHPHIAQIYHIEQIDDVLFFAMELISGGDLGDIIQDRNKLNMTEGLEYLITMCQTLDFVCRMNIVHRDIKPANIMINDQRQLKVVDFGVAIVNDGTDKKTSEGLGSPLYVSPECIMGRELDFRSDIYSLGATFYHLFAGEPPFKGNSVEVVLSKHLKETLVPLKKINPILSSKLSDIIGKMMAKDPNERYQDYKVIIEELNALLHAT